MNSRWSKGGIAVILLFAMFAGGCGGSSNVNTIEGEFIGTASNGTTVVEFDARPAINGSERTLNVLATDGSSVGEFFTGTITGNIFDLRSDTNDADITGTIDTFGVTANLTINGGAAQSVSGSAVAGVAGLYTVTLVMPSGSTAGSVTGSSNNGTQPSGSISANATGNSFAVSGTLAPSGGAVQDFDGFVTQDSSGQQHWIISSDLTIHGAGVTGSGSGFASPTAS